MPLTQSNLEVLISFSYCWRAYCYEFSESEIKDMQFSGAIKEGKLLVSKTSSSFKGCYEGLLLA